MQEMMANIIRQVCKHSEVNTIAMMQFLMMTKIFATTMTTGKVEESDMNGVWNYDFDFPQSLPALHKLVLDEGSEEKFETPGYLILAGKGGLVSLNLNDLSLSGRASPESDVISSDVGFLKLIPNSPGLLVFCTNKCWTFSSRNLSLHRELDIGERLSLSDDVGTQDYAFFGIAHAEHQIPLYQARSFSWSNVSAASGKSLSSFLVTTNGASVNIDYRFTNPTTGLSSSMDLDPHCKYSFKVSYIYGFEHEGFAYFLTVQRESHGADSVFETRLIRFCSNDHDFVSYTEIMLECQLNSVLAARYNGTSPVRFNIARAASLTNVSFQLAQKYTLTSPSEKVLFVAFGIGRGNSHEADASLGTGVCMYDMTKVKTEFVTAQKNCYLGTGKILQWVNHSEQKCTTDMNKASSIDDRFCGSSLNVGIGGRFPLNAKTVYSTDEYLASSMGIINIDNKTVAVFSTQDGHFLKAVVDGSQAHAHAIRDLSVGLPPSSLPRDDAEDNMVIDAAGEYAYVLTGPRVSRVALKSCSLHANCSQCVLAGDPLHCGWCIERSLCTTQAQCHEAWYRDSCPPVIHDFHPKSGPRQGGTQVTITGYNFGNGSQGSAVVKVALTDCRIERRNATAIQCVTGLSPVAIEGHIKVTVTDPSRTTVGYKIGGHSKSSPQHPIFSYKVPELLNMFPTVGPRSGGSKITLFGRNLNIGAKQAVAIAGLSCQLHKLTSETAICNTSSLERNVPLVSGAASITIDSVVVHSSASLLFRYAEDPFIVDVSPLSSIISGGMMMTIAGGNLNVVQTPMMCVGVNSSCESCVAKTDDTTMLCPTPNMTGILFPSSNRSDPVQISFIMNNVHSLRDFPITHRNISRLWYTVDPVIQNFDLHPPIDDQQKQLFISILGEDLNLAASSADYSIRLNERVCNVTHLERTRIDCTVFQRLDSYDVEYIMVAPGGIQGKTSVWSLSTIAAMSIAGALLSFLCALCFLWMKRLRRGPFKTRHFQTVPNVIYTCGGNGIDGTHEFGPSAGLRRFHPTLNLTPDLMEVEATAGAPGWRYGPALLDEESQRLLHGSNLLIPSSMLFLRDVIGQGHFGYVYRGLLKHGVKGEMEVAVKTLKSLAECIYTSPIESRKFLEEALRMRQFDHIHVLQLVGVVLDRGDRQPMVVLPFMKHGDLLSYIRADCHRPTVKSLMEMSIQIADGMAYLANLKFVHRDLAARNCMLDDNMQVKVADFGLSRDIYERDYYSSDDRKAKLPVKWMALESLEKGIYNTKTDVWSFGVVVWELLTRGVCPYPEVDNWDIVKYLKIGRRMLQPAYCPDALFHLLRLCWHPEAGLRPTFEDLAFAIQTIISAMESTTNQRVVGLDVTYVNMDTTQEYLIPLTGADDEKLYHVHSL